MNKATRKAIIAGNWKMNMTPSEAAAAVKKTAELVKGKDGCEVVLCVPFVDIAAAIEAAKGTNVVIHSWMSAQMKPFYSFLIFYPRLYIF